MCFISINIFFIVLVNNNIAPVLPQLIFYLCETVQLFLKL